MQESDDVPPATFQFTVRDDDDCFILTAEENVLAELLSEQTYVDCARILNQLSPEAKDELRAALGFLQSKKSFRTKPESK